MYYCVIFELHLNRMIIADEEWLLKGKIVENKNQTILIWLPTSNKRLIFN